MAATQTEVSGRFVYFSVSEEYADNNWR